MNLRLTYLPFILSAYASAATVNDLTFTLNGTNTGYVVLDCYENATGILDIPNSYNGAPVTSIGDYAFSGCFNLTTITLPDSVSSSGDAAEQYVSNSTTNTAQSNGSRRRLRSNPCSIQKNLIN
jgi:hypothetical protein